MSGTALASLQTDLDSLIKTGMKRIPLPLESYEKVGSLPLSAKRLLNYYAEVEPKDARSTTALLPTPGLIPFPDVTYEHAPVYALNFDSPGSLYAVVGTHFYRSRAEVAFGPFVTHDLGDVGSPSGDFAAHLMPTIAANTQVTVVCIPPRAYVCSQTGALNEIGGDFPGARSVAYLDGYFVFTSVGGDGQWFVSALLDPTAFDALDFAFSDAVPSVLRRAMVVNRELWLVGDEGVEIWYDSGNADFPFRRRVGGFIPLGAASIKSCVVADGSLFWLATNGVVLRSNGYQPERVSTHAIEAVIRGTFEFESGGPSNFKYAFTHTQDGHIFYILTTSDRTLAYDCATKSWADRSSGADGSGPWRPSCATFTAGQTFFGDSTLGQAFVPSSSATTDAGGAVLRQAVLPPLWAHSYRAFCNRLEIEMDVGTAKAAGDITLEWSDDGGITWTGSRTMTSGAIGAYRRRVFATRLGSFRQRVFRVSTLGAPVLYAIDADVSGGTAG